MDKLYIIIPAYNEEDNIRTVIEDWYPVIEKNNGDGESRLIIINDGSLDNTYQILMEEKEKRPLLHPISKANSGHGATVLYGYKYAIMNGVDYVFQTDADGQTLPAEFDRLWEERNFYDMVIGDRAHRKDGISRKVVAYVLRVCICLCFQVKVADANTPFRLMKAKTLQELLEDIPPEFNLTNVLLTVLFHKKNKKVKYIPITFRQRQGGVNSINITKIFKIGIHAMSDFMKINKKLFS